MIETGFTHCENKTVTRLLYCDRCGEYLGRWRFENGKEDSEIERWNYCPYCGAVLDRVVGE
jgi:DNA-directed RNA polymerase subunit RPC12/RpoP